MAVSLLPKRRWVWLVAYLAPAVCLAVALQRTGTAEGRGPFWDKYGRVQPGMTEAEVNAILGAPDCVEGGGLMPSTSAWFEGEQTIAVDFGVPDGATEKRFRPGRDSSWVRERAPGPPGGPTAVEFILRWLGR